VSVEGEWFGIGTLCNCRFQIVFSDINGRVYETDNSATHAGCRGAAGRWTKDYNQRKRTGRVCVWVLEHGSRRGGAPCASIHP
jgi:hypothetical protein